MTTLTGEYVTSSFNQILWDFCDTPNNKIIMVQKGRRRKRQQQREEEKKVQSAPPHPLSHQFNAENLFGIKVKIKLSGVNLL